jgi:hypothetical protein
MERYFQAAVKLHRYLVSANWDGMALVGPDVGVRFNLRVGRFIKSYLPSLPWNDSLYYLQSQGYWVLGNWRLFLLTGEASYQQYAMRCSEQMLERQRSDGAWDYPNREWKGRVATAEGTWGSLGLLETYRRTKDVKFLAGALRWRRFLVDEVGFEQIGDELAVNYFWNRPTSRVPNNSAFVLRFLAELAHLTGERAYMHPCPGLVTFLSRAQKPTGEFPYMVKGRAEGVKCWEHFQCYQYNAFQCLDLMRYYELTSDAALPPLVASCLRFLRSGVEADGHSAFQCGSRYREITYHTAVLGASFATAGCLGFSGYEVFAERTFSYLLQLQRPDGSFPHSHGDYHFLSDRRSYPRVLAMILVHLVKGYEAARHAALRVAS